MTPGSWQALALALVATGIAGLVVAAWRLGRLDGNGGHTHRNVRRRGADPFANPADIADPDGAGFIADLQPAGRLPYIADETDGPGEPDEPHQPDWWDDPAPAGRVEVLTGPDRRIAQTAQLTASVLSRVREGLLGVEPDGTTATFTPAPGVTMPVSDDPDTTGWQPIADPKGLTAELAARYLT